MRNEEYDDGYDSKESFERADEDRPEDMERQEQRDLERYESTEGEEQYEEGELVNRETNTEFVTRLMEYAKTGPLMQAVIITGLQYYASHVVAQPASKFDSAFLNEQAWVDCAAELKRELEERMK